MVGKVRLGDTLYPRQPDDSVLDALLAAGVEIPHSCKAGVCQSCLMQAVQGQPSDSAQAGLKSTYRARGYFLACRWYPETDVMVKLPSMDDSAVTATINRLEKVNHDVIRLFIRPTAPFAATAGQYLTLLIPHGIARSYSIANSPQREGAIELHVRCVPHGQLSGWLREQATIGDTVYLRGPAGECFYHAEADRTFPMLLVGTATGLAPLFGIVRDALHQGHSGPIHLFHGVLHSRDLYLVESLKRLSEEHANFSYTPCVLHGEADGAYACGDVQELALAALIDKAATRVYLCGSPELVNTLKKKIFLAGVSLRHIFYDAFLPSQ